MPTTFPPDDDAEKTTRGTNVPDANNSSENLSMGWLLPLLLLVLAVGLFFYFRNGSGNSGTAVAPQFVLPSTDTIADKKATILPDSTKR